MGAKVAAEEGSARGYADAIIETKSFVWVFEFKFNKSAKRNIDEPLFTPLQNCRRV